MPYLCRMVVPPDIPLVAPRKRLHLVWTAVCITYSVLLGDVIIPPVYHPSTHASSLRSQFCLVQLCRNCIGLVAHICCGIIFAEVYKCIQVYSSEDFFLGHVLPSTIACCVYLQVLSGCLSLIPLPPYDGWEVLCSVLSLSWYTRLSTFVQRKSGWISFLSMTFLSVILFFNKTLQVWAFSISRLLVPVESLRMGLFFYDSFRRILDAKFHITDAFDAVTG